MLKIIIFNKQKNCAVAVINTLDFVRKRHKVS